MELSPDTAEGWGNEADLEELALAEWGYPSVDTIAMSQLSMAYVRRKRFEAKLIAQEIMVLLAKSIDAPNVEKPAPSGKKQGRRLSVVDLFNEMSSPLH